MNNIVNKMNDIVNKFLLTGDKFVPEMHLTQLTALGTLGFPYSACGPFTNYKERMQKFKEAGDSRYIYLNELDKACFQHDRAYGDFKDVPRRTAFDKALHDKTFDIAKNPKYDGCQSLISLAYTNYTTNWSEEDFVI